MPWLPRRTSCRGRGQSFDFPVARGSGSPFGSTLDRELDLAADIVFRYLQRLGQALAGRLEWFQSIESNTSETWILANETTSR